MKKYNIIHTPQPKNNNNKNNNNNTRTGSIL